MNHLNIITLLVLVVSSQHVRARVILPAIFNNGMVLQRNVNIPVWGKAAPGENITVRFLEQQLVAVAGDDSSWRVSLVPVPAGGPHTMTVAGSDTLVLNNILVGEVWICSGQSNMEFAMAKSLDAERDVSRANHPDIRLFLIKRALAEDPQFTCEATWQECSSTTVGKFSAVAYHFGKRLHEQLNVPIGLIQATWGGTPGECWMSREVLASEEELAPILDRWREDLAQYPDARKEYDKNLPQIMSDWEEAAGKARVAGQADPPRPQEPRGPGSRNTPGGQFNAMIVPLVPYAMKGVIWYQGEANAARAYQYRTLFPALIQDWRCRWGQGDFPFYFVQLPNLKRGPEPSRSGWAELREAQLLALHIPNTGMVVTIDVGDSLNLHPTNKRPVGLRLAAIAEAQLYGTTAATYSGPLYTSMTIDGDRITLAFDHVDGGLVAKDGLPLLGFMVAGTDKLFHTAEATIAGDRVQVRSEQVANPIAVRYAWADNPFCSLFNVAGLPASPFRTDDWPEVTFTRR